MEGKDEKLLADLELGMKRLIHLCDSLKDENKRLKESLRNKEYENSNLSSELNSLREKFNSLVFAKSFEGGNTSINESAFAKNKLLQLVRDVEKCITLLKN